MYEDCQPTLFWAVDKPPLLPNSEASSDLLHVTSVPESHSSPVDIFKVRTEAAVSQASTHTGTVHILDVRVHDLTVCERDRLGQMTKDLQWSVDIDAPVVTIQLLLLEKQFAEVYCEAFQGKLRMDRLINLFEALDQHHFWASHEMPQDLYDMLSPTSV